MSGAVEVRRLGREQLDELIETLRAWDTPGGYPLGLHAGDVGWHARLPDDKQRAAFDGSTFTVEAWHRMSSTAAYDPELDLLARDGDGAPVAAATAWSAGPERSAILEPVGSHPEHRGGDAQTSTSHAATG